MTEEQQYILDRIEHNDGCWLWTKAKVKKSGYGMIGLNRLTRPYNKTLAHQFSYIAFKGTIPDGMHVLHSCRNRHCCNPEHLRLGTNYDNVQDRKRDGTDSKVGSKGHNRGNNHGMSKLTDELVQQIRELYKSGHYYQKDLAKMFGMSQSTICDIVNYKIWIPVPFAR